MSDLKLKAWHIQNLVDVEPDAQVVLLVEAEQENAKLRKELAMYKSLQGETLEALREYEQRAEKAETEQYDIAGRFGSWLDEKPEIQGDKIGDTNFYILASFFIKQLRKELEK